jgi:hypothetical protein
VTTLITRKTFYRRGFRHRPIKASFPFGKLPVLRYDSDITSGKTHRSLFKSSQTIKTRRPELGGLTRNVFISLFVSLSENKFATHPINLISGLIRRAEASMYPFAATFEES